MEEVEKRLIELIEREERAKRESLLRRQENLFKKILERSEVILITGRRGAGKTALGYYILEQSPNPYVFGLPEGAWQYLPESITPLKSLENLPEKATIFIDEAALWFYSRSSSQKLNKYISQLVTEARHQEQLLIFATHTLRKLDIGVVMDADAIFFKEPSFLHSKFERSEIREITREVMRHFSRLKDDRRKYTYVLSHDYEGFIKTPLPSFWCEELSKVQINIELSPPAPDLSRRLGWLENVLKKPLERRHPEVNIDINLCEDGDGFIVKGTIKDFYKAQFAKPTISISGNIHEIEEVKERFSYTLKSSKITDLEDIVRNLLREQPVFHSYLKKIVDYEEEHEDDEQLRTVGWCYDDIKEVPWFELYKLFNLGVLRRVYTSRNYKGYLLADREVVKQVLSEER